jgi:hypothetical protein
MPKLDGFIYQDSIPSIACIVSVPLGRQAAPASGHDLYVFRLVEYRDGDRERVIHVALPSHFDVDVAYAEHLVHLA